MRRDCLILLGTALLLMGWGALIAFTPALHILDRAPAGYFASRPFPSLLPSAIFFTRLGSPPALLLLLLALVLFLPKSGQKRASLFLVTSLVLTALLDSLLKSLIARPRPELRLVAIDSPAFPSWHSATSTALALSFWLLFVRPLPPGRRKKTLGLLLLLWPLLIGGSRLVLDAHWTSDILAGWGLGLGLSLALFFGFYPRECLRGNS